MNEKLEKIVFNVKECYKESVLIENNKLQDILLNTLTDLKLLEKSIMNADKERNTKDTTSKRYTYEQVKAITKIQLKLAKELISYNVAEREILDIASSFPVHNIRQYNKRLKSTLAGVGTYGFAFPSNWAKALLEETNCDSNVINAFEEQQSLYFEKDGRRNEKLDKLLKDIRG